MSSSELSLICNCNASPFPDVYRLVAPAEDGVASRQVLVVIMVARNEHEIRQLAERVGRGHYLRCKLLATN